MNFFDLYDNTLLTSLWLIPLIGSLVVLFIPRGGAESIKWVALGFTIVTFLASIFALQSYVTARNWGSSPMAVPLQERAENNFLRWDLLMQPGLTQQERNQYASPVAFARLNTSAAGRRGGDTVLTAEELKIATHDLVTRKEWIPSFNIQYFLGLDGISLSLVLLTGLISVLACLASWNIEKQVKGYYSLFLLLLASMMGVFVALDLFLFYVFFEVMLLPMYFLIGIWGGENREYAAIKFLLYTLFGSVFILVAFLILYFYNSTLPATVGGQQFLAHTFDALKLSRAASESSYYPSHIQQIVFVLLLIGFSIKLPAVPFHTWLPDAHVQAPTPISMILAGILLKIGGYGLVRLAWPLAPVGAFDLSYYVAILGIVSILYGAFVAMAQTDFKKLVAYSSVSHMGYVTLGMAVMNLMPDPRYYAYGVNGAMFMMIAHGITSAGMFFLVGVIYDRAHTRDLNRLGGLFQPMPIYGGISFLIFFGSMGLPGLCGFIAEVLVVLSAFNYSIGLSILAAAAVILTAGYILWTLQRVFLGTNEQYRGMPDMNFREILIAAPLVVMTIVLGVFPQISVFEWMSPSVDQMVQTVAKANTAGTAPIAQVRQAERR